MRGTPGMGAARQAACCPSHLPGAAIRAAGCFGGGFGIALLLSEVCVNTPGGEVPQLLFLLSSELDFFPLIPLPCQLGSYRLVVISLKLGSAGTRKVCTYQL